VTLSEGEVLYDGRLIGGLPTMEIVSQGLTMVLSIAHRGYVLQTGRIVLGETAKGLIENPQMQKAYLGEVT
jgi:branched-chain amino acid transport system ATP-binding protein